MNMREAIEQILDDSVPFVPRMVFCHRDVFSSIQITTRQGFTFDHSHHQLLAVYVKNISLPHQFILVDYPNWLLDGEYEAWHLLFVYMTDRTEENFEALEDALEKIY